MWLFFVVVSGFVFCVGLFVVCLVFNVVIFLFSGVVGDVSFIFVGFFICVVVIGIVGYSWFCYSFFSDIFWELGKLEKDVIIMG